MNEKIGLVLSGGGVRAIAHIGLIKVLLENNIIPTQISGTSAGALIAALYAAGYSPEEMLSFFEETPILKFSLFALNKTGIIDSEKYIALFEKFFPLNSFEELNYPITITATNLISGNLEYFNKGELIKPLLASSALPPIFSPIEIKGDLFSDGGILNNFPIEPLTETCTKIIGSFVNSITRIEKTEINSSLKLLYRAYHIGLDSNYLTKFTNCDYVFLPNEVRNISVLDTKSIQHAYQLGYENAKREVEIILKSMV
ncbi:patatin-like phospholipase family protein [Lutibacter sp.]|uniref:patatin-like phospholipase family protein n=1 Tax=Lutibacter sp. TaxID=1925666 RepID=UPI00356608B1